MKPALICDNPHIPPAVTDVVLPGLVMTYMYYRIVFRPVPIVHWADVEKNELCKAN